MLVLARRKDETITIGDSIVITVLAVEGDRVKLGIAAPRDLPILRGEINQAIQEQNNLVYLVESSESTTFEALRQFLARGE